MGCRLGCALAPNERNFRGFLGEELSISRVVAPMLITFLKPRAAGNLSLTYPSITIIIMSQGYSSRHMHIVIFDGGTVTEDSDDVKTLSETDFGKLYSAINEATLRGRKSDTIMLVTLCSNVTFLESDLKEVVASIELDDEVSRVVMFSESLIVFLTQNNFVVTIRFVGAKKFLSSSPHVAAGDAFEALPEFKKDDSFEEDCAVSQSLASIKKLPTKRTPRKGRK